MSRSASPRPIIRPLNAGQACLCSSRRLCPLKLGVLPVALDGLVLHINSLLVVQAGLPVLLAMDFAVESVRPASRLQLIELRHITDQPRNQRLQRLVLPQMPARQDLLPALRALLLVFPIVVLYALGAKLVQAILDVERAREHVRAHLAKQAFLKAVKQF